MLTTETPDDTTGNNEVCNNCIVSWATAPAVLLKPQVVHTDVIIITNQDLQLIQKNVSIGCLINARNGLIKVIS